MVQITEDKLLNDRSSDRLKTPKIWGSMPFLSFELPEINNKLSLNINPNTYSTSDGITVYCIDLSIASLPVSKVVPTSINVFS